MQVIWKINYEGNISLLWHIIQCNEKINLGSADSIKRQTLYFSHSIEYLLLIVLYFYCWWGFFFSVFHSWIHPHKYLVRPFFYRTHKYGLAVYIVLLGSFLIKRLATLSPTNLSYHYIVLNNDCVHLLMAFFKSLINKMNNHCWSLIYVHTQSSQILSASVININDQDPQQMTIHWVDSYSSKKESFMCTNELF